MIKVEWSFEKAKHSYYASLSCLQYLASLNEKLETK